MKKENLIDLADALQIGAEEFDRKDLDEKIDRAYENYKNKKKEQKIINSKDYSESYYKKQINKLCNLEKITISKIQRYLKFGFTRAVKLIEFWTDNGCITKKENYWIIIDKSAFCNDLMNQVKLIK